MKQWGVLLLRSFFRTNDSLMKQCHSVLLSCCGAFQELSCSQLSGPVLINQTTEWQHRPEAMPSSDSRQKKKHTQAQGTLVDAKPKWQLWCMTKIRHDMRSIRISSGEFTAAKRQHLVHLAFNDCGTKFCIHRDSSYFFIYSFIQHCMWHPSVQPVFQVISNHKDWVGRRRTADFTADSMIPETNNINSLRIMASLCETQSSYKN